LRSNVSSDAGGAVVPNQVQLRLHRISMAAPVTIVTSALTGLVSRI
jgi:hypothetical protein